MAKIIELDKYRKKPMIEVTTDPKATNLSASIQLDSAKVKKMLKEIFEMKKLEDP